MKFFCWLVTLMVLMFSFSGTVVADERIFPASLISLQPSLVELDEQNRTEFINNSERLDKEAERNIDLFYERQLPIIWFAIGSVIIILIMSGKKIANIIHKHHLEVMAKANNPRSRAAKALELLRRQNLPGQGAFDQFYTKITYTIRTFIEEQYHVKAREQTTEEFFQDSKTVTMFTQETQKLLKEFLRYADLVKFAKYRPTNQDCEKAQELASHFIQTPTPPT